MANNLYSQTLPAARALDVAWNLLKTAEDDFEKASWAPAMPYNTLSNLWEAWGAFTAAERIGGLEKGDLDAFRERWDRMYDKQSETLKVTYEVKTRGSIANGTDEKA